LAIVEVALQRHASHILIRDCHHLPFLHRGNFSFRVQNEALDALLATDTVDGRTAGVTGGCTKHDEAASAFLLRKEVLKQVTQKLRM
jgi:hypothetical protein